MKHVVWNILFLQSLPIRDTVRDCLEKDPSERTDDDIEILMDFMHGFRVSHEYLSSPSIFCIMKYSYKVCPRVKNECV